MEAGSEETLDGVFEVMPKNHLANNKSAKEFFRKLKDYNDVRVYLAFGYKKIYNKKSRARKQHKAQNDAYTNCIKFFSCHI